MQKASELYTSIRKFNLAELMRLLTNPAGYSDNEWLEKRVCECVNEPMRLPLRGLPASEPSGLLGTELTRLRLARAVRGELGWDSWSRTSG